MPPQVLAALYEGVAKTLADPGFNEKMVTFGNKVSAMPPDRFKAYLEKEFARYQRILPPLGIEMDS